MIDLRIAPELVYHTGEAHWQQGKDGLDNEYGIQMPLFYSLRVSTGVTTIDGQYRLLGVVSPKGDDGELDRTRKVMLFVKCDVVAIGEEVLYKD